MFKILCRIIYIFTIANAAIASDSNSQHDNFFDIPHSTDEIVAYKAKGLYDEVLLTHAFMSCILRPDSFRHPGYLLQLKKDLLEKNKSVIYLDFKNIGGNNFLEFLKQMALTIKELIIELDIPLDEKNIETEYLKRIIADEFMHNLVSGRQLHYALGYMAQILSDKKEKNSWVLLDNLDASVFKSLENNFHSDMKYFLYTLTAIRDSHIERMVIIGNNPDYMPDNIIYFSPGHFGYKKIFGLTTTEMSQIRNARGLAAHNQDVGYMIGDEVMYPFFVMDEVRLKEDRDDDERLLGVLQSHIPVKLAKEIYNDFVRLSAKESIPLRVTVTTDLHDITHAECFWGQLWLRGYLTHEVSTKKFTHLRVVEHYMPFFKKLSKLFEPMTILSKK